MSLFARYYRAIVKVVASVALTVTSIVVAGTITSSTPAPIASSAAAAPISHMHPTTPGPPWG